MIVITKINIKEKTNLEFYCKSEEASTSQIWNKVENSWSERR